MNSSAITRDADTDPVADCLGRVVSNDTMGVDYRRLVLAACGPATRAQAGQFFQIRCPSFGSSAAYLRRPMSVYRADADDGRVEFLYKVTGVGTRGLSALTRGADVPILGPLGRGFRLDPRWQHVVVLGRGVGLATLAPLAELATARRIGVTAILSGRSDAHLISRCRFAAAGGQVVTVLDSDGTSDPANVERIIQGLVSGGRADAFFTCGSNRLLLLLQRLARAYGIPGQVAIEQQMACGLGMCFSCVRPFRVAGRVVSKRVCWDGPVFDLQETLGW
jgi:dihydroorotate dehydrogenase electron transfer subunit